MPPIPREGIPESPSLVLECYADPDNPDMHRVDLSMDLTDETPMGAIFHGPYAAMRAKAYADWIDRQKADAECGGRG